MVIEDVQGPQSVGAVMYWQGGHCYEWDDTERAWRLTAVRCDQHADMPGDPRAAWCEVRTESNT